MLIRRRDSISIGELRVTLVQISLRLCLKISDYGFISISIFRLENLPLMLASVYWKNCLMICRTIPMMVFWDLLGAKATGTSHSWSKSWISWMSPLCLCGLTSKESVFSVVYLINILDPLIME
jgi:hypothetical protein